MRYQCFERRAVRRHHHADAINANDSDTNSNGDANTAAHADTNSNAGSNSDTRQKTARPAGNRYTFT